MGKLINIDLTWFGMETYFVSFNYLVLAFISEIFLANLQYEPESWENN